MKRTPMSAYGCYIFFLFITVSITFPQVAPLSRTAPTGSSSFDTEWIFTTPEEVLKASKSAQEKGRSDLSLAILQKGKRIFPQAWNIRIALGDLFSQRELYILALEAYREAEALNPGNIDLWARIAVTYGKLERSDLAVQYYERIYEKKPDSLDAAADLGWIYFKTHQLKKGKVLLEASLSRFGPDRRLTMTLGTIYAGMYQYAEAKKYYLLAVKDALSKRDTRFASVAYYNLAILEKSFNHYIEALSATEHSLALEPRAPGYLSLGDLYEGRMEFSQAESAFLKAQQMDETPLSRLSLANLYRKFGQLEKALSMGKELLEQSDYAWMYYFGTTKNRHLMDIHELLRDTYKGLGNQHSLNAGSSLGEKLKSLFHRLRYRILEQYHTLAFQMYAGRVAEAYRKEENLLNASFTFKRAMEHYPVRALYHLRQAEILELTINPEAVRFYILERGKLEKDLSLLTQAAQLFSSPWEQENLEEALVHRALLLSQKVKTSRLLSFFTISSETDRNLEQELQGTLQRLMQINPGAISQYGLQVPALSKTTTTPVQ
ncbi:MAG: hypothetical protein N2442_02185 [Spirochaetes bacterium]|nr:hypothetical protein [Spirochaetota bacterium]